MIQVHGDDETFKACSRIALDIAVGEVHDHMILLMRRPAELQILAKRETSKSPLSYSPSSPVDQLFGCMD